MDNSRKETIWPQICDVDISSSSVKLNDLNDNNKPLSFRDADVLVSVADWLR
jgi:hypothetical protein